MSKILLLADDSVVIRKLVGLSFANEDVEVVTTDTGDDALARAREIQPDLVLADVVMPGKSGYEVCEAIKADASLRHIPVLLLTDTFEAFDEDRSRQAGSDGHITKPFETQNLVDRVMDLLSQAPASRTVATAELPSPLPEPAQPARNVTSDSASQPGARPRELGRFLMSIPMVIHAYNRPHLPWSGSRRSCSASMNRVGTRTSIA